MPALDPVIVLTARYALALLFLSAAVAKFRHLSYFRATLLSYDLLPVPAVRPAAFMLPAVELLIAAGMLAGVGTPRVMLAAAAMLALYTLAIAINIGRGRRDIDCGCSGPAQRQSLSGWLLVRNIALIAVALGGCTTPVARALGVLDFAVVLLAVTGGGILYAAVNQLSANLPQLTAMDDYMERA